MPILFNPHVAAYLPGRVHRSVLSNQNRYTALGRSMAAGDPARRFSDNRPQECRAGEALQSSGQRPHPPLPADRPDIGTPALALLHYRRRSCRLRWQRRCLSAVFRVHAEWCSLCASPPYERSAPRLPWGVKGGARAVGRHTLTNRHSFIAGVRRSSARNLHARASLGARCAVSAREEHHETTWRADDRRPKTSASCVDRRSLHSQPPHPQLHHPRQFGVHLRIPTIADTCSD